MFKRISGMLEEMSKPRGGWIRSIRQALGMTMEQLASRLDVTQSAIVQLEKSEEAGRITLNTLNKAALALNCRLVYILIPNTTLEEQLQTQARSVARTLVERVGHTMALEAQGVDAEEYEAQVAEITQDLIRNMSPEIWQ